MMDERESGLPRQPPEIREAGAACPGPRHPRQNPRNPHGFHTRSRFRTTRRASPGQPHHEPIPMKSKKNGPPAGLPADPREDFLKASTALSSRSSNQPHREREG
jgi:hypothetical protein